MEMEVGDRFVTLVVTTSAYCTSLVRGRQTSGSRPVSSSTSLQVAFFPVVASLLPLVIVPGVKGSSFILEFVS